VFVAGNRRFVLDNSPETSVNSYYPTLCNILEERGPKLHRGGSPKSR